MAVVVLNCDAKTVVATIARTGVLRIKRRVDNIRQVANDSAAARNIMTISVGLGEQRFARQSITARAIVARRFSVGLQRERMAFVETLDHSFFAWSRRDNGSRRRGHSYQKRWTFSFVLVAAGYSYLLVALFHAIIDVAEFDAWARPFV